MPPRLPPPLLALRPLQCLLPRQYPLLHLRTYASWDRRSRSSVPTPTNKRVLDEAIGMLEINFVDETGKFHSLVRLRDVLASIDRENYHVVCVNPNASADTPRVCKLISKADLIELELQSYISSREKRKKKNNPSSVMKEIELSWAISEHDLGHRMKRVQEFMEKGWRVALSLGTKKGMAKQPLGVMTELLDRVREECGAWGKECREPEGVVGKRYTMIFEGRQVAKKVGEGEVKDGEEPEEEVKGDEEPEGEVKDDGEQEEEVKDDEEPEEAGEKPEAGKVEETDVPKEKQGS